MSPLNSAARPHPRNQLRPKLRLLWAPSAISKTATFRAVPPATQADRKSKADQCTVTKGIGNTCRHRVPSYRKGVSNGNRSRNLSCARVWLCHRSHLASSMRRVGAAHWFRAARYRAHSQAKRRWNGRITQLWPASGRGRTVPLRRSCTTMLLRRLRAAAKIQKRSPDISIEAQ